MNLAQALLKLIRSIAEKVYDILIKEVAERLIDAVWNFLDPLPKGA